MIVVDTSAIMAILGAEPDARVFAESMEDNVVVLSTGTAVELFIVAFTRWGDDGIARTQALLAEMRRSSGRSERPK